MVDNINNVKINIVSLFRNNYLNRFHIRQMAKLIEKSHVGLLPHLRELEKSKILNSQEIGKSKVYSLNLNNDQVRELLSIAEKKRALELLENEVFMRKIYRESKDLDLTGSLVLFGSYASKTNTKESDIDLLYLGNLKEGESKKISELGKIYEKSIHLIHMNIKQFREQLSKKGSLINEIINNHIILYNQDVFINEIWRYYESK